MVGRRRGSFDVEEVIRQLRSLSEEDRARCMRAFAEPSDGEVSLLSDRVEGGANSRVAPPLIDESVLTLCG